MAKIVREVDQSAVLKQFDGTHGAEIVQSLKLPDGEVFVVREPVLIVDDDGNPLGRYVPYRA